MSEKEPYLWTGHLDEDGELVIGWQEAVSVNRRKVEAQRRRSEDRFRHAPFPLYGLPSSWTGDRKLGGGTWGTDPHGKESVEALSLVHGSNVEGRGPSLFVETSVPSDGVYGGGWLRLVAERVWVGMCATIEEARREEDAIEPGAPWSEPKRATPQRDDVIIPVEAVPTDFHTYRSGNEWVARATVGGYDITVQGYGFDPAGVELVRISDIEPYVHGGT